jgi:hypothetical protein
MGRIVFSCNADVGILVDTDIEALEHEHCRRKFPCSLDWKVELLLVPGRAYQWSLSLVALLLRQQVFLRKFTGFSCVSRINLRSWIMGWQFK